MEARAMMLGRANPWLAAAVLIATAEAAVAEGARIDPAGYRCIANTQGARTKIARPMIDVGPPFAEARCAAACEGTLHRLQPRALGRGGP
jgi:hypothetical protein